MQGFLQGVSDYERTHNLPFQLLNGVSFHYYPFRMHAAGRDNYPERSDRSGIRMVPGLRQLIRQTFGEDLPVAITEVNTNAGKVPLPQNLSALWWAETLGKLMDNQARLCCLFLHRRRG